MFKRIIATLTLGITSIFIAISILTLVGSVHPTGFQFSYQAHAITAKEQNLYAQNNILFYNDECVPAGNATLNSGGGINIADGGFKIDGSVDAKDFWYAEGCLNNGECTGHVYADGDTYINANPFLYNVTKVDHDFGDLQYIYAENYDINYDVWPPKFTEKTGPKSDRKYYWIVLPAYAYTNGLGETYVAKFENLSEPVYFITFDAHACQHQSQSYCHTCGSGWCVDDPDNTLIGKEFLGAFEQAGGDYTKVAQKTGKLTYFHRIAGRGEVLVHETATGGFAVGDNSTPSNSSSSPDSSSSTEGSSSSTASGDFSQIKTAKNANQSVFDTDQYGQWGANWDDNDTAGLKRALETYGDLAYQTGKAIGAPWKAIFAQMRYEDPGSVCGKNNFWGMGCPPGTTKGNGSNYDTLGDGFIGYANYATKICNGAQNVSDKSACEASLKVSDPLQYLKNLGPLWVQGDANGQGYWFIDAIQSSLKKLDAFLATDEGKAIVSQFGNYSGDAGGGSCSLATVEIPDYNQCSGDWANYSYNYAPGKTICSGGCGPSSMAMLVTALTGQTVYPNDIVDLTTSAGQYPNSDVGYELTQIVADKYNLETEKVPYSSKSDAYEKIKKYLNDGYVVHLSGEGSHPGFSNSNTSGHYIGLVSIDKDDKVRVANSNSVGNNTTDLQNIVDAIHNGAFVVLKNKNGPVCSGSSNGGSSGGGIDYCSGGSSASGSSGDSITNAGSEATSTCGAKVLASTKKIIDIASQYGFDYNQAHHDLSGQFDEILKGKYFETDCTGFASFVMYDAFGVKEVFWTGSIAGNSNYKEIPKDQVQVGDIFNYNNGCAAHGGIVTKIEDGKIVEIAQTGNSKGQKYLTSGTSAKNNRLGYSYYPNLDNGNLNCVNGKATDLKFYRYKECN